MASMKNVQNECGSFLISSIVDSRVTGMETKKSTKSFTSQGLKRLGHGLWRPSFGLVHEAPVMTETRVLFGIFTTRAHQGTLVSRKDLAIYYSFPDMGRLWM